MVKISEPIKQTDIQKCASCGLGVMHAGLPLFYRVTIQRYGIDHNAVMRQHGLELMLGGNAMLANVMGVDADIAKPITDLHDILICEICSTQAMMIALLAENDDEESNAS